MFDFIRKYNKFLMVGLLLLIIPGFGLFGIENVINLGTRSAAVAQVDGRDITRVEWDQAHEERIRRLRESMPDLDIRLLDSEQARYASLEGLVRDRVLIAAANKYRLHVSDQRLAQELMRNEVLASLRRTDGSLDIEAYRQLLGRQGMTPEAFEAQIRSDLSIRQVSEGVTGNSFAPVGLVDVSMGALFERRQVSVQLFSAADHMDQVQLTDADIQKFYNDNTELFLSPERVDVEYLVLDAAALADSVTLNESDVRAYYDQNAASLSGKEERRARHILLTVQADAPSAEKDKIRQAAQGLLGQLRQDPSKFAEFARVHSQDPGSAAQGGDLDFFTRGAMVKPFEDAVYSLNKGDISDLVETEFGFHIIQLVDIRAVPVPNFESMRAELEADLKRKQAQRIFAESAETFSNLVYEQADNLQAAADRLKLKIQTANGVTRKPSSNVGVLSNEKVLAALFESDAIESKQNTKAIETGASQLVAARVMQHHPARTQSLAEVRGQVTDRLMAQRAGQRARESGQKQLEAWRAGASTDAMPAPVIVSHAAPEGLPAEILKTALITPAQNLPAWAGTDLSSGGYAVVRVDSILPPAERSANVQLQVQQQYNQLLVNAESQALYESLKERFKVKLLVPMPNANGLPL